MLVRVIMANVRVPNHVAILMFHAQSRAGVIIHCDFRHESRITTHVVAATVDVVVVNVVRATSCPNVRQVLPALRSIPTRVDVREGNKLAHRGITRLVRSRYVCFSLFVVCQDVYRSRVKRRRIFVFLVPKRARRNGYLRAVYGLVEEARVRVGAVFVRV